MATGVCSGSPLRHEIDARDPSRLDELLRRSTAAVQERLGAGKISAPLRALVVTIAG